MKISERTKANLKRFFVIFTVLFFNSIQAQIEFEKGYFIDNSGNKIDCLIRNVDWKNNPESFSYKISENSSIINALLPDISEFAIVDGSKYLRAQVEIDRSSDITQNLDRSKQPKFKTEELFLKVIVEGSANLYAYYEENLQRFFVGNSDQEIIQLVYKKYLTEFEELKENSFFRQQLLNTLKCETVSISAFERLRYATSSLTTLFDNYNKCIDKNYTVSAEKKRKTKFNLWVRPGVSNSTLSISNEVIDEYNLNFPNAVSYRIGTEFEFVMPYNKNKWSVFFEPTYQKYSAEKEVTLMRNFSENEIFSAIVSYSSIELPVGVRHSFFLNKNSRIFLNVAFVNDFPLNSEIIVDQNRDLIIDSKENFILGMGYGIGDKFLIELRYQFERNILDKYAFWSSEFKSINFIIGYNLF